MPTPPAVVAHTPPATATTQPAGLAVKPAAANSRPASRLTVAPSGFALGAIVQWSDGSSANINGEFVRVGQSVKGAKVLAIHESYVELEMDGECFTLGDAPPMAQAP